MKNTFSELREAAIKRRDERIEFARREFQQTLAEIESIRRRITGKENPKARKPMGSPIDAIILSIMPQDRTFTIDEIHQAMDTAHPSRKFIKTTIATSLNRLSKQGKIQKACEGHGNKRATYAPLGIKVEQTRTILEWIELALERSGKPLTTIELIVAMQEIGFEPQSNRKHLVTYINSMLRADTQFVLVGKAWAKKLGR